MWPFFSLLALFLACKATSSLAASPGVFEDGGHTQVSAMTVGKRSHIIFQFNFLSNVTFVSPALPGQRRESVHPG